MLTPAAACRLAEPLLRPITWGAVLFCFLGMLLGLMAPISGGGNAMTKVLLVSIPATWISLLLFLTLAFWAALGLILEYRLAFLVVHAVAPTGGMFTFLALWTGAIWSKGAAGVWWQGDARQIAELVLLFLYLAVIGIPVLVPDSRRADRMAAVLAVLGLAYVTLLFFAVQWWLIHQMDSGAGSVPLGLNWQLAVAVISVSIGFWLYATMAALMRLRQIVLEREFAPWNTA